LSAAGPAAATDPLGVPTDRQAPTCSAVPSGTVLGIANLAGRELLLVEQDETGPARLLGIDADTCAPVLDEPY
jgi:hypothetical protein